MSTPSRRSILRAGIGAAALAGASACGQQEQTKSGDTTVSATDVPVGSGLIVKDTYYVVTQPTAGTFEAFVRTCPHAGCLVNSVQSTQIVCPCHNSKFSIKDGSVLSGPAQAGLSKAKVTKNGDQLTVSG